MHVMTRVALLFFVLVSGQLVSATNDDLDLVRQHYAAAAYEEALAHIEGLASDRVTAPLEQYRALCLLALGRFQEGEAAFERLVRQSPQFVIAEGDIAPRLYVVFREVRRRVLSAIAGERYERGKAHFEADRFTDAATELRSVQRLLHDPMLRADPATADLRQLAEGFLRLAELSAARAPEPTDALARAGTAVDPNAALSPVVSRPASPTAPAAKIYSAADAEVTPPAPLSRDMPVWDPPAVMARYLEYHGEVEVVVDERGRVEHVEITRRTIPSYDASLMHATARWRFEPARRSERAVKYRLAYEFALAPTR